jgi:hypothetical protein
MKYLSFFVASVLFTSVLFLGCIDKDSMLVEVLVSMRWAHLVEMVE